ncbi:hypothetical protein FDECE_18632, partial [Fusarium decemcellulare]
ASEPRSPTPEPRSSTPKPQVSSPKPQTYKTFMPGAWDDDADDSVYGKPSVASTYLRRSIRHEDQASADASDSESSEPAFSRACIAETEPENPTTPPKHQDDVPTPKGPTRLVKEILNLKTISIYIPSQHQHLHVQAASPESAAQLSQTLGQSVYPQLPGTFSMHKTASAQPQSPSPVTSNDDNTLEVNLSPISLRFDASLGFLLAMVVGKLLEAVKAKKTPSTRETKQDASDKKTPNVKVTLEEVKLDFLNRLGGVSDTPERYLDPAAFIFDQEVLLNTTLQNMV